jgi:predicted ABC-type ATPase
MDNPQLLFVAGPNGAGKSTFSKILSNPGAIIFDVDSVIPRIEAQSPEMPKKQVYLAATQEFFKQATEAIRLKQDFTLETSFRDEQLVDIVAEFRRYGYTTNMVYLTLDSIEQSIKRVSERVSKGGHDVDLRNIQPNYEIGLQCLERLADRFDNLDVLDASIEHGIHKPLLKIAQKRMVYLNDNLPAGLARTVTNIADQFRDNPRDYYLGR